MSDELIDCLLPVGDQETVATRLKELLGAGIDELLVGIIPLVDVEDDYERNFAQLFDLVRRL
jgi:hypothetical protein